MMAGGGEPSLVVMSGCATSSDPFILLTPCASLPRGSHLQLLAPIWREGGGACI